jgi:uncharacterized protein DUF6894
MPKFFFNVCAPDQCFCDKTGCEIAGPQEAHRHATQVARRVIVLSGLAGYHPDLKGWSIAVMDEQQRSIDTVMVPIEQGCDNEPQRRTSVPQPGKDCLYAVRKREAGWVILARGGSMLVCKNYIEAVGIAVAAVGILGRPKAASEARTSDARAITW